MREIHVSVENKKLSKESAFAFHYNWKLYWRNCAALMEDFLKKIKHIKIKSIGFHFYAELKKRSSSGVEKWKSTR
jgi:hypothetical protein